MELTSFLLCVFILNASGSLGLHTNYDGTYITTLVSPDHPGIYPSDTQIEWNVVTDPDQMVVIDVKILDIEHIWDTVHIHHVSTDGMTATNLSLASSSVTSLILPGGSTVVSFCSDVIEQRQGFVMEFTSYDCDTLIYGHST
ncbi:uncharacterized protein LOC105443842 [Strongylocentrotus purpuratus]|uniref:CUB domain-containing protein n=1 Tax=Strongylocentrotus purpuratus TaxID=7668 RepID=A0A7M7NXA5_STRPU|nr:uncharacterized protein LOC105443842 [Strongylocentrotus purpuratus]